MEAQIRKQEEEARKAAQKAGKTYNTVAIGNISFIWPSPSSSRITSSFGDRESPTEGASSNHQGIDIGASTGAGIVAAASGTVTISTYSYSAGNYIMIHHGGGSLYCLYALFRTPGFSGAGSVAGTVNCKSGFYRVFHRTASPLWDQSEWKLCKSSEVCKPIMS
ncbi:M23 family metallopeptidase [Lacrimispora xylanisolvens]|uniref:M23 family metallopeptidase n=1 Tax=Lacrimispora xylanisolvens TaxID=384636 RepID=UPI003D9CAEB4